GAARRGVPGLASAGAAAHPCGGRRGARGRLPRGRGPPARRARFGDRRRGASATPGPRAAAAARRYPRVRIALSERIAIIGPGRMGLALGAALVQCQAAERLVFYGRALEPPPHPLFDPDHPGGLYRPGIGPIEEGTTIVVLAVPDHALPEVAYDLAMVGRAPVGCAALHLSGALSTDVLAPLHFAGYAVGSMSPFQTVADPWSGGDRLIGAAFALAGEPAAIAAGRRLVRALGGRDLVIPPNLRPLYHAAAVFAS